MPRTRNPWTPRKTAVGGRSRRAAQGSRIRRRLCTRRTRCDACGGDGVQVERVKQVRWEMKRQYRWLLIPRMIRVSTPCRACNAHGKVMA